MNQLLRLVLPILSCCVCLGSPTPGQPPTVVSLRPAAGATDVEAEAVTELVVTFDRDMQTSAFSFCGGGPAFPKIPDGKRPFWRDARTCVLPVALEPDHTYRMSLNCPAATNFRSKDGAQLAPVPWTFTTRPAKPLSPREQREQNEATLKAAEELIEQRYSYRDLRGVDWQRLFRKERTALLKAESPRAFTAALAEALRPMEDIHCRLQFGEDVFGLGRRSVDALFRLEQLEPLLGKVEMVGQKAMAARTDDGVGYLALGTFSNELDEAAVAAKLAALRDCKAMIVDARPNSGGDELVAMRVAQWFVDGEKVYAKNRYKLPADDRNAGRDGYGPVLERRIRGYEDADKQYRGRVVLLQSAYVMSSAEAFVLMMRQAPDCTTVGQATYGCSGNPRVYDLPNGAKLVLSSWQAMRPDGSCFEGEGIAPDVEVECSSEDMGSGDPILARALELVREG